MSESKEKELAFSILWWILKKKQERSDWSSIRLESFRRAQEILNQYDIDVTNHLDNVLGEFPRDNVSGEVLLPSTLREPEFPSKIAEDIVKKVKPAKTPPSDMINAAKMYYDMRNKMLDVNEYLAKWNDNSKDVISALDLSANRKKFISKYENAPAAFEFVVAKSFCTLFEIPLFVEYNAPIVPRERSCVVWRGRLEGYLPRDHAPGGGSDIIIYARDYYALIEATLRYTKRQWKEEVEPIFRHAKNFIEGMELDPSDVYLIFVTPKKVLEGTYDWIHSRAEEFNVLALDTENLIKLVKISLFIDGLPHAEIRRALQNLHKRSVEDIVADTYLEHITEEVDEWCEEALRPYLDLFLATKAYEVVIQNKGFCKVAKVIDELSKDPEVRDYIKLGGIARITQLQKVLIDRRRNLLRYLSLFGLAREINGYLAALSTEEFGNRFLKMYGHIKKIGQTPKKIKG